MEELKKKFKIGDKVKFNDCGFWWDGVIVGFSTNCIDRPVIDIKDEDGYILCFYESQVKKINTIDSFTNEYAFLSNFYEPGYVMIDGKVFINSEAAFHSYKCPERRDEFTNLNPKDAKRLGRSVKMRSDWDDIRDDVMYNVCFLKFIQNPDLTKKLLATDMDILIEGNTWGDTYWGVCDGVGKNRLGKILMKVRENIRTNNYDLREIPNIPEE